MTCVTYTYGYDELHRLISENNNDATEVLEPMVIDLDYRDDNHVHAATSAMINNDTEDVHPFSYDANGNMTTGFDLSDLVNPPARTVTYSSDNMPVQIVHSVNGTTTLA